MRVLYVKYNYTLCLLSGTITCCGNGQGTVIPPLLTNRNVRSVTMLPCRMLLVVRTAEQKQPNHSSRETRSIFGASWMTKRLGMIDQL